MTCFQAKSQPKRPKRDVFEQANHADGRRGRDGSARGLVVQADIAADDGHVEGATRLGQSADGLGQLPGNGRLSGIAEVEAIRDGDGLCSDAGEVPGGLGDGLGGALARIEARVTRIAIGGQGEALWVPSTRTTAAPPPGPRTVLAWTVESYWRKANFLLRKLGASPASSPGQCLAVRPNYPAMASGEKSERHPSYPRL